MEYDIEEVEALRPFDGIVAVEDGGRVPYLWISTTIQ
jgi:hypothetical protein